jgi:hypothetical protein
MEDNQNKGLSPKALKNLEQNEFLRRFEWGLEPVPILDFSTIAIFDAERIKPVREEKEVDGKMVLEFKFKYLIGVDALPYDIRVRELIVDAKTSAKIDAYLREGFYMLDIKILRTPKGIRYKIEPFEDYPSVRAYRTPLPISFWRYIE